MYLIYTVIWNDRHHSTGNYHLIKIFGLFFIVLSLTFTLKTVTRFEHESEFLEVIVLKKNPNARLTPKVPLTHQSLSAVVYQYGVWVSLNCCCPQTPARWPLTLPQWMWWEVCWSQTADVGHVHWCRSTQLSCDVPVPRGITSVSSSTRDGWWLSALPVTDPARFRIPSILPVPYWTCLSDVLVLKLPVPDWSKLNLLNILPVSVSCFGVVLHTHWVCLYHWTI